MTRCSSPVCALWLLALVVVPVACGSHDDATWDGSPVPPLPPPSSGSVAAAPVMVLLEGGPDDGTAIAHDSVRFDVRTLPPEARPRLRCRTTGSFATPYDGEGCTSPLQLTSVGEGEKAILVMALGPEGEVGASVERRWQVDQQGPRATMQQVMSTSPWGSAGVTAFSFSCEGEPCTFQCALDDAKARPCSSPHLVKVEPGQHRMQITAYDRAGNGSYAVHGASPWLTWTVAGRR